MSKQPPKRHAYIDQAVHWVAEGGGQERIVQTIVDRFKLPRKEAVKLHAEALDVLSNWPDKPAGWHKRWLGIFIERTMEAEDWRMALEARRDLAKVERLADGLKRSGEIKAEKAGLLAYIVEVARRVDAGEIGVAKGQALAQLLQTAIKTVDMEEEEIGDLGPRPETGHAELTPKVAADIIEIGKWKGGK